LCLSSPTIVDEYGIGGARGAASVVYSLLRTGMLLGDDAILDDALLAARQLTPASIAGDASFDVLHGAAGIILALLALYRVRRADQLIELAHQCGRQLLAQRRPVRSPGGTIYLAWLGGDGRPRTGFAHGAAGIALALLRLYSATGVAEYLAAALEAVRCEDSFLSPARGGGWPSPTLGYTALAERAHAPALLPTNWCRGTAGIALSRIACTAGAHTPELRASAEHALATVLSDSDHATAAFDHACCGALGGIELLLSAGLRWGMPSLLTAAHERASTMVRRARMAGHYRLSTSSRAHVDDPTLLRGTAGIGYGLLRLCHPEVLPSFLSWE